MKILLLRNNITDTNDLAKGIDQATQWAASIGLILNFTIEDTTRQFTSIHYSNDVNPDGYIVDPTEIFQEAKSFNVPFDCPVLIFDNTKIQGGMPTNPADDGEIIQMSTEWYNGYPEVFAQFLLHELCHYFFASSGIIDITHNQYQSATYHNSPNQTWYLYLLTTLKAFWPQNMPTYTYFNPKDDPLMIGLSPTLLQALDTARGIAGVPFSITSGLRTVTQNSSAGGVANSSHLTGQAADIATTDSTRQAILKGLLTCGTPLFIEDCPDHIHADIDSSIHTLGWAMVAQVG